MNKKTKFQQAIEDVQRTAQFNSEGTWGIEIGFIKGASYERERAKKLTDAIYLSLAMTDSGTATLLKLALKAYESEE